MGPAAIRRKYESRIIGIMKRIAGACRERNLVVGEPYEMSDDQYEWWLTVKKPGRDPAADVENDDIDVRFTICESEQYDGSRCGVTFRVDFTAVGGEIVGGFSPYNYTDECWVSRLNPAAVEARFRLMEDASVESAADLIVNYNATREKHV